MEPTVYADQSPESPLKARGESEFSHFVQKESFHFSPSPGYIVRFRPDEPAFTIGFQDGNLGFRSKVGREWNLATGPGSIMDLAWKPRNSFLEPHVMFAAKPEGKLLKWTSMDEGNFEVVCLNPANQYMTIDCASSHLIAAGLLPQIELRTLVDYKQLQLIGERQIKSKLLTVRHYPGSVRLLYSGGWDTVKLWDLRCQKRTADLPTQLGGHSVGMTSDHQTMVTGGPLGKRNLLVWDLRNLVEPTVSIEWSGDKTNPMIHTVKIVDDKIILVGATDDECPAKCFSLQSGELWANFPELSKSAMSVDARGKKVAITDSTGKCATYQMKFAK